MTTGHYFAFQSLFRDGRRICRECDLNYDEGDHIEITTLKPYTNYVCPSGGGLGHSGIYTGALRPENRRLNQHVCTCGLEFVEEDRETWRLTWEMQTPFTPEWRAQSVVRSKHAAHQQRDGLLELIDRGEPIRNVELVQLVTTEVPR